MSENRREYLLRLAASAFDRHENVQERFIAYGVGWAEYSNICDQVAAIIVGYLAAPEEVRAAVVRAYTSPAALEVLT